MKKKKTFYIITIILLFIYTNVCAQGFNLPTDYIRNNVQGNNLNLEKVNGSPYLDDVFKLGDITINENSYKGLLRYNAFNDEIELKENSGQIISLLKRPYIKVSLANNNYAIHPFENAGKVRQGYFIEHSKGNEEVVFLERFKKVIIAGQEATSSYKKKSPARLAEETKYYMKIGKNPAKIVKLNKKGILSSFSANKAEKLKSFLKENKLKLKSKAEVIQLVNYYNSTI